SAYQGQMRPKVAREPGRLNEEIVPVDAALQTDEHPRLETTLEGLAALQPAFKKNGVVTAGNASGICGAAAAVMLSTEARARKNGLKPLAKIVSWGITGCDPSIMGIGPVSAIRAGLDR